MERRILTSGAILTVSILIFIGIFFIHTRSKDSANPIKSIPQDASLIIKLNGFGLPISLNQNNSKVWQDILPLQSINRLNEDISNIDSILQKNPKLYDAVNENNLFISGHLSSNRKLYFLTVLSLPEGVDQRDLTKMLNYSSHLTISQRKYEGKTILHVILANKRSLYFSSFNGILLHSSSPVLIEDAIRQSTLTTSLLDNNGFNKMYEATGKNKEANLFIDLKQISKLFSLFANKRVASNAKGYNNFGNWAEFDINLKDDIILLNGFSYPTDSANSFIKTISSLEPVRLSMSEILPASISGFIAYGVSSPEKYYKNYLKYLNDIGKLSTYNANLKNMNSNYGVNFESFFLNLLDDQFALAYKDHPSSSDCSKYIIFKCKSGNVAKVKIEELIKKIKPKTDGKLEYTYSPDNEVKFSIYRIPIYPLFGRLMGDFFDVFEENYIVIIDNYIVVAESYKDASLFAYDFMLKRTLKNNEQYSGFSNNLSIKSFFLLYSNTAHSQSFYKSYLSPEVQKNWTKNNAVFQKAQTAGIQISEISNLPYFNIFLKHQNDYKGKPQTVWESLLDTNLSKKPKFVVNHYTKQNEIVVQDDNYKLYLINQAGRILWKVSLDESINSDIFQIDFYKNSKLQLLFSTENKIHLLDRNGNYVERYPIKLRSKSTTGLSVFDYDANRNYRIFIPCKNKKVYAYSKEGNIINGWNFEGSDHEVKQPINHFRVSEKDFIVFGDKSNTYILNRKGNTRIQLDGSFSKSANNNYHLFNSGNISDSYLTTSDTSGSIIKIFFNGKIERKTLLKLSKNHFFDFKDINADGKSDFIFLDEKKLYVYNSDGSIIFEKSLKNNAIMSPVYYHFSYTDRKVGIVTENDKIYLINNNGATYKGFPVEGKTQFTVGYFDLTSSRFNLIVGGRNNFLYNYAVE